MSLVARLDQYYPTRALRRALPGGSQAGFERRQVAPSTSVIVSGLQDPQAEFDVQVMAATAESGSCPRRSAPASTAPRLRATRRACGSATSFSWPGQLARDGSGALAARGTADGDRLHLSRAAAARAGGCDSGPDLVLKAQVYSVKPRETRALSRFHTVWQNGFRRGHPATTVVAVRHPAFLTTEATVEVN
jgi:hypothetical protein